MRKRCKYFENCEQSEKNLRNCRYCMDYRQQLKEFVSNKIDNSWYKNAKIDYDVDGHCIGIDFNKDNMIIFHEENGEKLMTIISYYWDYTPEQLYNIWMEEDWQEEA